MSARPVRIVASETGRPHGIVVGLAGLLALLSASCCVLPIALAIAGLGGSWLAVLGPFVAYRTAILVGVGAFLAWSWVRLYRSRRCAEGRRGAVALTALATLAFVVAAASPAWEAGAVQGMMDLWTATR